MGPDRRDARSDSPQVVTHEVTVASHGRPPRDSGSAAARRRVGLSVGSIGAIGALAAIAAISLGGGSARHADPVTARGPVGVAAAYGFPLGCMSVTIPAADRTYARADLSHVAGCGGNTGYAPAIFHYVAGRWRLVPDAIGYTCNPNAVPPVVDRALELCVGNIRQGCARIGTPVQGRPAPPGFGWPCAKLPDISGVV
ncbi:MAG TPA: hypothetical protein VFH80_20575 [Solirubrobacteraceae bacterium]|nr:hypothetical protein [Solirubrobacteraceae bacterium]